MKPTYEELEAQIKQLAAENAGLNKFIAESCFVQAGEIPSWHQAIDHAPETPTTSAFLAEVRAHARNELIDELEARFTELAQTSPTPELQSGAAGAAGFVSTFRKGVQS